MINGKLFEVLEKYIPYSFNADGPSQQAVSTLQWGIPEVVQQRLGNSVKSIHFERSVVNKPILSPNHYWKMMSTKSGPVIQAIQTLKDAQNIESLRKDVLEAIMPYFQDNVLRLDYLITMAIKE
ncbi:MAG: hypothetical protein ABJB76_05805 [Candidatus Nitrosocosmicus sp.]